MRSAVSRLAQEEHEIALPSMGHGVAVNLLTNPSVVAQLSQALQPQSIADIFFCCSTAESGTTATIYC